MLGIEILEREIWFFLELFKVSIKWRRLCGGGGGVFYL